MFDMSQADVEIMLQHYGWAGVGELAEETEPKIDELMQLDCDEMWHKGYGAYISEDHGTQRRSNRNIPLRGR